MGLVDKIYESIYNIEEISLRSGIYSYEISDRELKDYLLTVPTTKLEDLEERLNKLLRYQSKLKMSAIKIKVKINIDKKERKFINQVYTIVNQSNSDFTFNCGEIDNGSIDINTLLTRNDYEYKLFIDIKELNIGMQDLFTIKLLSKSMTGGYTLIYREINNKQEVFLSAHKYKKRKINPEIIYNDEVVTSMISRVNEIVDSGEKLEEDKINLIEVVMYLMYLRISSNTKNDLIYLDGVTAQLLSLLYMVKQEIGSYRKVPIDFIFKAVKVLSSLMIKESNTDEITVEYNTIEEHLIFTRVECTPEYLSKISQLEEDCKAIQSKI
jgi:hypothetical protein